MRSVVAPGPGAPGVIVGAVLALALPVHIDAQKHPMPALLLAGLVCLVLWLLVSRLNTGGRESRRSRRRGDRRNPPPPPPGRRGPYA